MLKNDSSKRSWLPDNKKITSFLNIPVASNILHLHIIYPDDEKYRASLEKSFLVLFFSSIKNPGCNFGISFSRNSYAVNAESSRIYAYMYEQRKGSNRWERFFLRTITYA